jgi:DNA polymerase elongation subunit (family B)
MYDARLGQSVTLCGRTIVKHMNAKLNEVITGTYDHTGEACIYADTDSAYFSAYEALKDKPEYADVEWTREHIIVLYDDIADRVNDSFPLFMHNTFNTTLERGGIIKAGRELVASKGLFIKKKKYAVLMYDKEGERLDVNNKPGKIKAMGLDLKRADTPKYMQEFLTKILMDVLTGVREQEMFDDIRRFRETFKEKPGWEKGTPKAVKALVDYAERKAQAASGQIDATIAKGTKLKVNTPGHVQAALNWNTLLDVHGDRYSMRIGDGSKIIVCDLLPNAFGMRKVAYPIDEPHLPKWFKDLPFDHRAMENAIIDKKLLNLIGVLNWDLEETKNRLADEFFVF